MTDSNNLIQSWFDHFKYDVYIFDFDRTLLKLHSWEDRDLTKPLIKEEFDLHVPFPQMDFEDLPFLQAFFQACRDHGSYILIVSDQWTSNIHHYLNNVGLTQYFAILGRDFDDYNIIQQKLAGTKIARINYGIQKIKEKTGNNVCLSQSLFLDDDLSNIYQLRGKCKWVGHGIWLAEGPFGPYVLHERLSGRIPLLCNNPANHMHRVCPHLNL